MVAKLKLLAGNLATSSSQPPTRYRHIGSKMNIRPTVLITNCTMSVRVSDHMPPMVEYTTTTPPPSRTDIQNGRPNSTCSTVPMARVEVTPIIRA
ncbi:hypothetical protein D9M71_562510 [compost metagenome]